MGANAMIIIAVALFVVALLIGWILSQSRKYGQTQEAIDLKAERQSSENTIAQFRQQLEQKEKSLEELRERLSAAQQEKAAAEAKLGETLKNAEEQKRLLERAEEKLATTFQALSGESLKSNNQAFIQLAKETLESVLSRAKGEFGEKEESIKNIVGSLEQALQRYEGQLNDLERKRAADYGSLESQIKSLLTANQQLQKETGNLVTALRRPEVRGRWGEVTLKRVVELAGMSEHCDFTEQVSISTEDGRIRPDMVVHLPANRELVVDSKVSLDAYMDATVAEDEKARAELIAKHAQQVRKHMKVLSGKAYWDQFAQTPEFVVMFIPGESFLSAALAADHTLIEEGMESRVIIATPTTLIALLRAVAFGWRQELIAKHAQEIANLGKEIYDRFQPFLQHLNRTGDYLAQATGSFNKMITSLERRVMVSVRKFRELGAAGDKELPEVQSIEQISVRTQSNGAAEQVENSADE